MEVEWKLVLGNCYKIPPVPIDDFCNPTAAFSQRRASASSGGPHCSAVLSGGVVMERRHSRAA